MHNVERDEAARFAERLQHACEQAGIPDERGRFAKIGRMAEYPIRPFVSGSTGSKSHPMSGASCWHDGCA